MTSTDPLRPVKPNYPEPEPYEADRFLLDVLEAAAWLLPGDRAKEFASSLDDAG